MKEGQISKVNVLFFESKNFDIFHHFNFFKLVLGFGNITIFVESQLFFNLQLKKVLLMIFKITAILKLKDFHFRFYKLILFSVLKLINIVT